MKRKWVGTLQFIIAWCICGSLCHAQIPAADSVNAKVSSSLIAYYKQEPQEKLFIHTSQSVYTGGQTIWFAVYATAYGKPTALSKIVYVQLINTAGKVMLQNMLPLVNGFSHGDIDLPDSIKTGWYQLKGFTSWMMNFGDEGYFHQNIYIQNTADTIRKIESPVTAKKYHVTFFPEGGDMIAGQECNIAFRAVDDSGFPVRINGEVMDDQKQIAAQIITTHNGMGLFRLDVLTGNYMAVINFPDKTTQRIMLPSIKKEGIAMRVNENSLSNIQIKIAYSGSPARYKNVLLAAFQNSGNVITYPLDLSRGINQFEIRKNLFSTGILRLTLFDRDEKPLAERLVFIDNHDNADLRLKADTVVKSPHALEIFNLKPGNMMNTFSGGNFSVSVTDADAFPKDSTDNIISTLLLSSELRGQIYNAGWYFESAGQMQLLDLVMLTSGWRHFKWNEVLDDKLIKLQYPVERSPYIAGKIVNYQKPMVGNPQYVIKLLIINQDSSRYIGYVSPDSTGSFILKDYNHNGISTLFMETTDNKNRVKKLQIKLLNTLSDSLENVRFMPFTVNETEIPVTDYLLSKGISEKRDLMQTTGIVLKTVRIKGEKKNPTEKVIADHVNLLYHSPVEYTLDLVNDPAPDISLLDYIRGRFPGLQITGDSSFIYLSSSTIMGHPKPYIYLNEHLLSDINQVLSINLHNVALIRFMPPPVGFAPYNGGSVGALMIYTKKGADELASIESREKFDQYTFNGNSITREFSSPDYSTLKNNVPQDNRVNLYWNPHLDMDNTGSVKFQFYNTDHAGKFRIIIQGMDAGGHPGYLDETF